MENNHPANQIKSDVREKRSVSGHRDRMITDTSNTTSTMKYKNRRRRKTAPDIRHTFTVNAATTLIGYYVVLCIFQTPCCVEACQSPLRPIYNATQRQYVSCNAWEPDCPHGSYCQMATNDWKARLQINTEFTLFLCCADEAVFKNSHAASIVPPTPTSVPGVTPTPPPYFPDPMTEFATTTPTGINGLLANANILSAVGNGIPAMLNIANNANVASIGNILPASAGNANGHTNGKPPNANLHPGYTTPHPFIGMQPPGSPKPPPTQPKAGQKNPMLPPQAQIMLPGNGNRVIDGPQVIQLIVGEVNQSGADGMYKYSGTVTLIQDSGLNILVDSGSAQNRNKLLAALAQQGIKPQNIQLVVYTHAHPDHIGNDNLFPYAQKLYSTTVYKGDEYMPLQHMQEPSMRLTQNVEVWQTPGHTYQHNSVIVRNVPNDGAVAISGDLFMNEEGMSNPAIWQSISVDKEMQQNMRNMILCQVDHIIPGHGMPFRVKPEYKSAAACSGRKAMLTRNRRTKPMARKS